MSVARDSGDRNGRIPPAGAGYRVVAVEGPCIVTDKGCCCVAPLTYYNDPARPPVDEATWEAMRQAVIAFPGLWEAARELLGACLRARIALTYHNLLGPKELLEESIAKAVGLGLGIDSLRPQDTPPPTGYVDPETLAEEHDGFETDTHDLGGEGGGA
jgi:hypothetical protein